MTKYQDLKQEVKRSWKLKNVKVLPMMMKNLTEIKNHPWEYHYKQTTIGSRPGLSNDPEESPRHKTLKTENFTTWSVNRDPLTEMKVDTLSPH